MKSKGTLTKTLTLLAVVATLALAIGITGTSEASAAEVNATDDATVSIQVSTKTMVDITPDEFSWTGVNPGTAGGWRNSTPVTRAQIENIGSTNITHVWFNTTHPSERPFGGGNNGTYNSGNYIAIAKKGQKNFTFIDRLEFNETTELVYLSDPDGTTPPDSSTWVYGRFRNTSKEYFWMMDNVDDCSSADFYLGEDPHTKTQTGSADFSSCAGPESPIDPSGDGCAYGSLSTGVSGYCEAEVSVGGESYTAIVDNSTLGGSNTPEVHLVKWNADLGGEYFWDSTDDGKIYPGDSIVAEVNAYVPYGVAKGYSEEGTLTVLVNSI